MHYVSLLGIIIYSISIGRFPLLKLSSLPLCYLCYNCTTTSQPSNMPFFPIVPKTSLDELIPFLDLHLEGPGSASISPTLDQWTANTLQPRRAERRHLRGEEAHFASQAFLFHDLLDSTAASSYVNKSPFLPPLGNHFLFFFPDFLIHILLLTHLVHSSSYKSQSGEVKSHLILLRL